ncbi:MAG: hypothetical protein KME16_02150 [Scytolyngbya sp. HA4215-MV1]|jgi:Gpi18-like mannosyltransferase|nr:hypothetical protein [Scytolyngbya sp. HA4215-MV1]
MKKIIAMVRTNEFIFVFTMWLLSRLFIIISTGFLASFVSLPATYSGADIPFGFVPGHIPTFSWDSLANWDGAWYRQIATTGYTYAGTTQQSSIVFFPVFPSLVRGVMTFGLPFEVAAPLVNNMAFLGTLMILHGWICDRYNVGSARWVTAVLAWCPFSLFTAVAYTEGLFLLFSTAALKSFEQGYYRWAALWGSLSTATRITGITLIPTFLLVAWKEKKPVAAYWSGLLTSVGLLAFSLYCYLRFGDALAFIHAQKAFHVGYGIQAWFKLFRKPNFSAIYGLLKLLMVFGGGYLLWYFRNKLNWVLTIYGFSSLALIISRANSVGRYAYGIVSLSIALGLLLALNPRWGYAVMGFFAVLLAVLSVRFVWWQWVA